jgi:hypothetical protein
MARHCSKSPEHDADHGEADECGNGRSVAFKVASQAAVTTDPRERSFDQCLNNVAKCGFEWSSFIERKGRGRPQLLIVVSPSQHTSQFVTGDSELKSDTRTRLPGDERSPFFRSLTSRSYSSSTLPK